MSIVNDQDANAARERGFRETAARSAANAKAEADRGAVYAAQMQEAVRQQGAKSQHSTPGEGIRATGDTQRHIAQEAARYERANTLSGIERINIAAAVSEKLYREANAVGKPLPDSNTMQRAQRAAFSAAVDAKLGAK
jgi:hypothetical protein